MPFTDTENDEILARFGLPELPEPFEDYDPDDDDPPELATLVIFRFRQENIRLDGEFLLADAQEYCSRDDTRDPDGDWFAGFFRA